MEEREKPSRQKAGQKFLQGDHGQGNLGDHIIITGGFRSGVGRSAVTVACLD
ncbi:hypothetical protein Acr_22g0010030 [Actinidia rufa]|uniref:Uncharacterized protein n=1 Tax=Actinidia rufa TaxID=165716 RepID=A0A7J0GLE9_9ERIC|nr:hypothetical protein Acr_22g0010030 [Actinidia rufa]